MLRSAVAELLILISSHVLTKNGAGDGIRTRDPNLGKVVLYQLSYTRTE